MAPQSPEPRTPNAPLLLRLAPAVLGVVGAAATALTFGSTDPIAAGGIAVLFGFAATASGCCDCYCSSCRLDAVIILQNSGQFVHFFNREVYQLLSKCFQICHCQLIFVVYDKNIVRFCKSLEAK